MKLSHLAFACFCYGRLTDYDNSYLLFRQATNPTVDITNANHREALLTWLNHWGSRQFAIAYHAFASEELLKWYEEFSAQLPPLAKNIWELTDDDYHSIGRAYDSLMSRTASFRHRNANEFPVTFGPTGAAKILFALRPNAFPPWDDPIRGSLERDDSAESYISFLKSVNEELQQIQPTCEANGFSLSDLPSRLVRNSSSVPKLIDEYYWVTLTNDWSLPDCATLRNWASWCSQD